MGSKYSQVIGESPEKASDGVSDPEDGVDQHWLVVLLTHPVVLKKDGMTEKLKMIVVPGAHLAGDGVEDIAIVKVPALVAQLVGTALHQADHVVPDNHQLRASEPNKKGT